MVQVSIRATRPGKKILGAILAAISLTVGPAATGWAQKNPTATQPLHISVFGGATGTETELDQGRNLGITAGVDLGVLPYRWLRPAIEARGTIAIDKGRIDAQKNVMAGIRLGGDYRRLHPYGDLLAGRAQIDYLGKGIQVPGTATIYTSSSTWAAAVGGGADYDVLRHFAIKGDAQYERLGTPVTTGHIYPYTVTAGVVYYLGGGFKRNRKR